MPGGIMPGMPIGGMPIMGGGMPIIIGGGMPGMPNMGGGILGPMLPKPFAMDMNFAEGFRNPDMSHESATAC